MKPEEMPGGSRRCMLPLKHLAGDVSCVPDPQNAMAKVIQYMPVYPAPGQIVERFPGGCWDMLFQGIGKGEMNMAVEKGRQYGVSGKIHPEGLGGWLRR